MNKLRYFDSFSAGDGRLSSCQSHDSYVVLRFCFVQSTRLWKKISISEKIYSLFFLFPVLLTKNCSGMFFVESKVIETLNLGQFLEILSKVSDPVVRCNKNSSIMKSH